MEMLRVTHQPDEFELVALDYCVTYEVSPPSWESARTEFKPLQNDGSYISGHTIIGDAFHDSMATGAMTMVGDSQIRRSPTSRPSNSPARSWAMPRMRWRRWTPSWPAPTS
jgi:hypothetical protein